MKLNKILTLLAISASFNVHALSWLSPNAGDDGDPTRPGNNSYTKLESAGVNNKLKPLGSGLIEDSIDSKLCVENKTDQPHVLRAIGISKTGWPDDLERPDKQYNNPTTTVRAHRMSCRALLIDRGDADFVLLVDGKPAPLHMLIRFNDPKDPFDNTYLWAVKKDSALTSTSSKVSDGYISAVTKQGQSIFYITEESLK